ncbi:unnamed protein product [Pedinophyceae sp. YPF-701]|nr:unnamed protein product [Pedinophyceae sp. YPF-701]
MEVSSGNAFLLHRDAALNSVTVGYHDPARDPSCASPRARASVADSGHTPGAAAPTHISWLHEAASTHAKKYAGQEGGQPESPASARRLPGLSLPPDALSSRRCSGLMDPAANARGSAGLVDDAAVFSASARVSAVGAPDAPGDPSDSTRSVRRERATPLLPQRTRAALRSGVPSELLLLSQSAHGRASSRGTHTPTPTFSGPRRTGFSARAEPQQRSVTCNGESARAEPQQRSVTCNGESAGPKGLSPASVANTPSVKVFAKSSSARTETSRGRLIDNAADLEADADADAECVAAGAAAPRQGRSVRVSHIGLSQAGLHTGSSTGRDSSATPNYSRVSNVSALGPVKSTCESPRYVGTIAESGPGAASAAEPAREASTAGAGKKKSRGLFRCLGKKVTAVVAE